MDKQRKSFFRLDKSLNFMSSLAAICIGLLLGLVFLLFSNPSQAFPGFFTILTGGFSDAKSMGQVLYFAAPIIMTGLSVGFASKTGLFNIGASGQFIIGAYAAVLVGAQCDFLPGATLWMTALLAALIAGAIWGCIPGLLKAFFNVNEVISCIMLNYIGMYLVNYLIVKTTYDSTKNQSLRVLSNANLPKMGFNRIFSDSSANSGILIAIIMAVILYIVLEKTAFGFELKACGLNKNAAKYSGINEKRSIVMSMLISGAMAGLGGALLFLAGSGKGIDVVDVMAAEGFTGIPVALLALHNPIAIIFSGLLLAYLRVGGFNMLLFSFSPQIIEIIVAIIIYFSAFSLVIKNFISKLAKKSDLKTRGG